MIYIITGGIDEGKTREMVSIYRRLNRGDGVVSKKIFIEPTGFTGYEIQRLSTGEKLPLAYKIGYEPPGWDEIHRTGIFSFSKKAFEFAGRVMDEILAKGIEPVFIDEIGPLELQGRGFGALLEKVLKSQKQSYIVVRSHCLGDVIKKFGIKDYKINKL